MHRKYWLKYNENNHNPSGYGCVDLFNRAVTNGAGAKTLAPGKADLTLHNKININMRLRINKHFPGITKSYIFRWVLTMSDLSCIIYT